MEDNEKERLFFVDDLIRVALVSPKNRVIVARKNEDGKEELFVISVEPLEDSDQLETTHSQPTL